MIETNDYTVICTVCMVSVLKYLRGTGEGVMEPIIKVSVGDGLAGGGPNRNGGPPLRFDGVDRPM